MVDCGVGDETGFGEADGGGEVGFDARITRSSTVGVEAGGKIDRHSFGIGRAAEGVHLEHERGERFAERTLRAEADQGVELHERSILRGGRTERAAQHGGVQSVELFARERGEVVPREGGAYQDAPAER